MGTLDKGNKLPETPYNKRNRSWKKQISRTRRSSFGHPIKGTEGLSFPGSTWFHIHNLPHKQKKWRLVHVRNYYYYYYTDSQIEICAGDAGAPLAYRFKKSWTLVGVASWGFGCNRQGMPGVYAKVSEFTSWIDFTVAKG